MAAGAQHSHQDPDWFKVLDTLVWVSVAVVVIIAVETFAGDMLREKIQGIRLRRSPAPAEQEAS